VFLGEDYIEYRDLDESRIIDFKHRRIYNISLTETNRSETSLYSEIAFRMREMPNRLLMEGMLGEPGLVEHLFSMRAPKSAPPKSTVRRNRIEYTVAEYPLMDLTTEGYPLKKWGIMRFCVFLRYFTGVHPDILEYLESKQVLPLNFDLYRYDLNNTAYNFTFVGAEEVERSFRTANRFDSLPEKTNELSAITARLNPGEFKAACEKVKKAAVNRVEEGRKLEAFLLFLEYTLCTDKPMPREYAEREKEITDDLDVQLMAAAIHPGKAKERIRLAIRHLQALSSRAGEGNRALMIIQANHLRALGKLELAQQVLRKVLSENPYITAAWKDLGDVYYQKYDMENAWRCWDTGRRIHPGHRIFQAVNRLETRLLDEHPEFFLLY